MHAVSNGEKVYHRPTHVSPVRSCLGLICFCKFYALLLADLVFVLPQMTVQVLRVFMIALIFTVSTGLVFPCSKNLALFRLIPTAPRARSAVKRLSAEPRTLDRGSTWSLSSPPASSRSESVSGAAGGQGACQPQRRNMIVG